MDAAERRSLAVQAAVGLASFLTPFSYGALSVAMPTIGSDFDFSPRQMAAVMMVHLVFSTSGNLPAGRLSDRFGRKLVFMAGSFFFALSSMMAGLSFGPGMLVAARAVQGVGDALTFGVSAAVLVSVVPAERTGRALGLNIMFVYAGLALGPLAGGLFTSWLSWRAGFLLCSLLGLVVLVVIGRWYGEVASSHPGDLDARGMALYLPGMLALITGLALQPSFWGLGLVLACVPFFLALYRWELRREFPLLDVTYLLGNAAFTRSNLTSILGYGAGFSTGFLVSLALQGVMGLRADETGVFLLIQPLVLTVVSPLAGMLSDRFHPARVSAAGLAFLGATLCGLGGFTHQTPLAGFGLLLALSGIGFALFVSPNINAIMRSTDARHTNMASGLLASTRGLGMCVSLSATGIVLALLAGEAAGGGAGPEILPALRACFAVSGILAFAGAAVSWVSAGRRGRLPG